MCDRQDFRVRVGADPKTEFDAEGLLDALKKALDERALNTEMDHHLATATAATHATAAAARR